MADTVGGERGQEPNHSLREGVYQRKKDFKRISSDVRQACHVG